MQSRSKVWTQPVALLLAAGLSARAPQPRPQLPRPTPDRKHWKSATASRAIISSALIASADRDTPAAEVYYREALRADPRNPDLLERAFAAALANGDEPSADSLAERLLMRDPSNSLARLAIAVHDDRPGQFAAARVHLAGGDACAARDVTTALLTAWSYAGQATSAMRSIRSTAFATRRSSRFATITLD